MKTKTYHLSNLGSFAPSGVTNNGGYVTYHDSPRYDSASESKLRDWSESRISSIRNAALTELAERSIESWRKGN